MASWPDEVWEPPVINDERTFAPFVHANDHTVANQELVAVQQWLKARDLVGDLKADYGVAADGVTDDTSALQAAFNEAASAYGMVFLPRGSMVHSAALEIPDGVIVQGAGRNVSIFKPTTAVAEHAITNKINAGVNPPSQAWALRDFRVQGNAVTRCGIRVRGGQYVDLRNLRVDSFSAAGAYAYDLTSFYDQTAGAWRRVIHPTLYACHAFTSHNGLRMTKHYAEVTNKELQDNVATLTVGAGHRFVVGDSVTVAGVDATFNGTFTLTAVTATTISYAKTAGNVSSTSATGTAGDPATFGANYVTTYGGLYSGFTGYGVHLDYGEGCTFMGTRATTSIDAATSWRINDSVATLLGCNGDNSFGDGNTAKGFHITSPSGSSCLLLNPTGDGPTDRIVDENDTTIVLRHPFSKVWKYGASGTKPAASSVRVGSSFFDTTLNKPLWSDGTNWRTADGSTV